MEAEATAGGVPVAWHLQDLSQPGAAAGWLASVLDAVDDAPASVTLILNAGVVEPIGPITALHETTLLSPSADQPGHADDHDRRVHRAHRPLRLPAQGAGDLVRAPRATRCRAGARTAPARPRSTCSIRSVNAEYAAACRSRARCARVALAPGVVDTDMQETIRGADFAAVQRFRDLSGRTTSSPRPTRPRAASWLIWIVRLRHDRTRRHPQLLNRIMNRTARVRMPARSSTAAA